MTTDLYILAFAPAEHVEPLAGFLTPKRMAGIMRAYMIDSSLRNGGVLTDATWS